MLLVLYRHCGGAVTAFCSILNGTPSWRLNCRLSLRSDVQSIPRSNPIDFPSIVKLLRDLFRVIMLL
jgi:hypothetical protein